MKKELWEGRGEFRKQKDHENFDSQKQYALVALILVITLFVAVYIY